ncbi:hypothetical protein DPX16_5394 [Anabarilius grahami]|uniref:Uncharacterized protein n=1 Tax=Anabarilius grahami TaxID=495550 RepID=A0A3N0YG07_ANAGA|nr:hypothetical protein DPX16_5394 [Anabarilius grahami]
MATVRSQVRLRQSLLPFVGKLFTPRRHSTTRQTAIKHVQSDENRLRPTPTDSPKRSMKGSVGGKVDYGPDPSPLLHKGQSLISPLHKGHRSPIQDWVHHNSKPKTRSDIVSRPRPRTTTAPMPMSGSAIPLRPKFRSTGITALVWMGVSGRECVWVLRIGRYNNVLCGRKRELFE